jgi:hypothetical protein
MDASERLDRLEAIVATIAEGTAALMKRSDQHEEQIQHLRELTEKHDAHIGVLIQMMDELIRTHGKDKE